VDVRSELVANLLRPVRFRETLIALADHGIETFEEVGPGSVLTGLVKRTIQRAAA
jgi:[acyl-carrier-protein] S-malonyltransferase